MDLLVHSQQSRTLYGFIRGILIVTTNMWVYFQDALQAGGTRDDLIKGLSGGALGLMGTVVTIGVGWLKDRDASADRLRRLDEATKRVTFWSAWLEAVKPLDSGDDRRIWEERARTELLLASGAVQSLGRSELSEKATAKNENFDGWKRNLPWWRRWFLVYTPVRQIAWFPRFLFYIYFLGAVARTLADLSSGALKSTFLKVITDLGICLLCRWWSVSVEKPKVRD